VKTCNENNELFDDNISNCVITFVTSCRKGISQSALPYRRSVPTVRIFYLSFET
jgi:hypothetical protein